MPARRKYPNELRERAVRMVLEIRQREDRGHGELARVGRQLGVHPEALRGRVKQAEIDNGTRPGTASADAQRIAELEREDREALRASARAACGSACTAFVTDLFARKIVGWQVADHLRAGLALDALEMAIVARQDGIASQLVHHSDRDVQYRYSPYTAGNWIAPMPPNVSIHRGLISTPARTS